MLIQRAVALGVMRIIRRYRAAIFFGAMLVLSSVLVVLQYGANQSRHLELREALILLHSRGYTNEAGRLYEKLLKDLPKLSSRGLMDDFQRTRGLVNPAEPQPENPVWRYHWVISNELETRSESTLVRARKLAGE